jgi:transcriptional regulator with XRE-family HTH domain
MKTLRQRRIEAGLTLEQVRDATGLSIGLLSGMEAGCKTITERSARRLAPVLGLKKWHVLVRVEK